jgi:uncharacterized membrane protein
MTDIEQQIEELTRHLQEIKMLQTQLNVQLQAVEAQLQIVKASVPGNPGTIAATTKPPDVPKDITGRPQTKTISPGNEGRRQKTAFRINNEWEDFIGTNVISKIGILVTVIGVFIGAKYAIDNELIRPSLRIIAGYLSAAALILVSLRLKQQYKYFSSVLMGGGLSVAYFITYIAYSFYAFYASGPAFILMVVTTAAAVAIALWYDQKVIALLGQVGAYSIPFLLGHADGNIFILFGYITVINLGLLALSFFKDWKLLYHVAFFLTWLVYFASIIIGEKVAANFTAGMTFLAVNFFTFYATFLSYKIFKRQRFQLAEVGILLLNNLLFFFIGAYLIADEYPKTHFLTWFTVANALIHLLVGYSVYRVRLADQSVFQFLVGFGLLFITISIPIELDANWVTALWVIEAIILSFVGYNSGRQLYLEIAFPLVILSFFSLLQDWNQNYPFIKGSVITADYNRTPFLNTNFALSLFVCLCLGSNGFYNKEIDFKKRYFTGKFFRNLLLLTFPVILYLALFNEIHFAWDKAGWKKVDETISSFRSISLIIFTCLYFAGWLFSNIQSIKNESLHRLLMAGFVASNVVFLLQGLNDLGELRHQYIRHFPHASASLLIIRYACFIALAALWGAGWSACKVFKSSESVRRGISTLFNLVLLSIISNECIQWMDVGGFQDQYKLGLSLIFGTYALTLLFVGMKSKKQHLRLSAIILFAATLVKLFFYDLASLSTVSKTIVLVLLGILLLLASYLYNKYKNLLFAKDEDAV